MNLYTIKTFTEVSLMDSPVRFIKSNLIRVLIALDLITIIMLVIFMFKPSFAESFYSRGIYPALTFIMGRFTDIVRVSISEVLLIGLLGVILIRLGIGIYRMIAGKKSFKNTFLHFLRQTFILASILFVWFYFMWGFNYYRLPLELKTKTISPETEINDQLFEETLQAMIERANRLYMSTISRSNRSYDQLEEKVDLAVSDAIQHIDNNKLNPATKSKVSITNILEFSATLGMISPFTLESHLSKELIGAEIPYIMAHEKTHLYGYANETEANYIAFVACMESDDNYFKYSAVSQVLRYFLAQYRYRHTDEEYEKLFSQLDRGIVNEYIKQRERARKRHNIFTEALNWIYDLYLKANNVSGGVMAYSRVTQMIMKSEKLNEYLDIVNEDISDYDDFIINDESFEFFGIDPPEDNEAGDE
jgi:hypothetical protein